MVYGMPFWKLFVLLGGDPAIATDDKVEEQYFLEKKLFFVGRLVEGIPILVLAILVLQEEGDNTFAWLSLVPSVILLLPIAVYVVEMLCCKTYTWRTQELSSDQTQKLSSELVRV